MQQTINWGILGTGKIAKIFANELLKLPDAKLLGIASRSQEKSNSFAAIHNVSRVYGSYESLAVDPDINIAYIATPHSQHCENTILCLTNKKAVLCEKPIALNSNELRLMVECARRNYVFLMEAMWTRCLPVIIKVHDWLHAKAIGDLRMLSADYCFNPDNLNQEGRLLNKDLAGGVLLDVGVYPLALAFLVFGRKPDKIIAETIHSKTGVDLQTMLILKYGEQAMAQLACSVCAKTPGMAVVSGTKGLIIIDAPFWHGTAAKLIINGQDIINIRGETGFQFEIAEAMQCLRSNKIESDLIPLATSVAITECLDKIRKQIRLHYPMDK